MGELGFASVRWGTRVHGWKTSWAWRAGLWHDVSMQNTSCEQAKLEEGGVLVCREGWGYAG